jgi:hypothetical protein
MTHRAYCTPRIELCPKCRSELLEMLSNWGFGHPFNRKPTAA